MKVNGIELGPNSPAKGLRTCRSETAEEQLCDDLVAKIAGTQAVVKFSQAQAAQQTRGISDRRYRVYGTAFWFEVKAEDGKLTMSQHEFLLQELQHGALACCGTLDDLRHLLMRLHAAFDAGLGKGRQSRLEVIDDARGWCLDRIGQWAERGYRKERPTRAARRPR
jgi:hypothetical protein